MAEFYRKKKKVCYMCTGKTIDYKDVDILKSIHKAAMQANDMKQFEEIIANLL